MSDIGNWGCATEELQMTVSFFGHHSNQSRVDIMHKPPMWQAMLAMKTHRSHKQNASGPNSGPMYISNNLKIDVY